jgi:uncharacterized membrane protein YdjX (TVP38/TMEM64 family)
MSMRNAIFLALLLLAAGAGMAFSSEIAEGFRRLLAYIPALGPWAYLVYSAVVAAVVVLLIPGIAVTMGGGFLFGVVKGTALFMIGEMAGACLAFAIARLLLGPRLRRYFLRHPRMGILEGLLAGEGWKFIALTRMTPFFPFKLSNYFFGSTSLRFRDFFWGSLLGTLPLSVAVVYLGSIAADLTSLEKGSLRDSPWALGLSLGTACLAVAGMAWVSRRAGRAYREKLAALGIDSQPVVVPGPELPRRA